MAEPTIKAVKTYAIVAGEPGGTLPSPAAPQSSQQHEVLTGETTNEPWFPTSQESSDGYPDFSKKQYPPVGYCIYCGGREELSREHILPFGLGGKTVLGSASCKECAKVTGAFEGVVQRGPMGCVRKVVRLQSRNKHRGVPETVQLDVVKRGKSTVLTVPLEHAPLFLYFPIFEPPRCLGGRTGVGIDVTGVAGVRFGPSPEEFGRRHGLQQIVIRSGPYEPVAFARMLAKIAYCFAFAEGRLQALDGESVVLPGILGKNDDVGNWVGTFREPLKSCPEGMLHRLEFHEVSDGGSFLVCEIQLFASSSAPSYGVVLGRMK